MNRRQFFRQLAGAAAATALVPPALRGTLPVPGTFYRPKTGDLVAPMLVGVNWGAFDGHAAPLQLTFYNPNDEPVEIVGTVGYNFETSPGGIVSPARTTWVWGRAGDFELTPAPESEQAFLDWLQVLP